MSKSLKATLILTLGVATATAAGAEPVHREAQRGVEQTASLGDQIWWARDFEGTDGVVLLQPVDVRWNDNVALFLDKGTELVTIRDDDLKVCRRHTEMRVRYVKFTGWRECLIDEDDDGRFDKITRRKLGASRKLQPGIAYQRQAVPFQGNGAWSKLSTLTFNGSTNDAVVMTYREFSDGYTSPYMTDTLTIARPTSFPTTIAVKGRSLTILALDNQGMRYRID